jgi:hypothetical protein
MKVGARVRVIDVPEHLPIDDPADEVPLRKLFELCVGRVFPIVAIEGELAELEVGEVVGVPAYMHSIWLESAFLEVVPTS